MHYISSRGSPTFGCVQYIAHTFTNSYKLAECSLYSRQPMREFTMRAELAAKLATICSYAQEHLSSGGHSLDRNALSNLLSDGEVTAWLKSLGPLTPVMRQAKKTTKDQERNLQLRESGPN